MFFAHNMYDMERIVELRGLEGVSSDVTHAYMSCNAEDVKKALEIGIPCTGANDYGAYNIYFDDYGRICFEYMQRCVTREYRYVESIEEAVDWMNRLMNNRG